MAEDDEVNISMVPVYDPPDWLTASRPGTRLLGPLPMPAVPSTIQRTSLTEMSVAEFDLLEEFLAIPASAASSDDFESANVDNPNAGLDHNHMIPIIPPKRQAISLLGGLTLYTPNQEVVHSFHKTFNNPPEHEGTVQPLTIPPVDLMSSVSTLAGDVRHYADNVDIEYDAFAEAGRSVQQQFHELAQDQSCQSSAYANPLLITHYNDQTTESLHDDQFERAGQIYVAYIKKKNQKVLNSHGDSDSQSDSVRHPHTKEEVQWARQYLSKEAKVWIKRKCSKMAETEQPALMQVDRAMPQQSEIQSSLIGSELDPRAQSALSPSKSASNLKQSVTRKISQSGSNETSGFQHSTHSLKEPPESPEECAATSSMVEKFMCPTCPKIFTGNHFLENHLRKSSCGRSKTKPDKKSLASSAFTPPSLIVDDNLSNNEKQMRTYPARLRLFSTELAQLSQRGQSTSLPALAYVPDKHMDNTDQQSKGFLPDVNIASAKGTKRRRSGPSSKPTLHSPAPLLANDE